MEDDSGKRTIKKIQTFVEKHWEKNHLYYFVHEHRMERFYGRREIETDDSVIYCSGCSSAIAADSTYVGCRQCKSCFFHEQCAELPKKITHPCHELHPLTLQLVQHPNSQTVCLGCDLPLRETSYYGCITCSVYFHQFCLELPPEIIHEAYESCFAEEPHCLVLNYNGAGEVLESRTAFSYVCDTCDFATSIPELVSKTIGHILILVPYPTEVTEHFHDSTHFDFLYHLYDDGFDPFGPEAICFICGEAVHSLGFFFCEDCKIHLHVGCALPPTFISDRHRAHFLELSDSDDHFCSTSTYYDDFDCNHCGKLLHPGLPVYKCPETDCGGFVAHCYCEFIQGGVSICHIPDDEEMGTERVVMNLLKKERVLMVKYPVVSVPEVELKWVQELTSLNNDIEIEGNEKVKKLFKEEDFVGCSDFAKIMEENEDRYFDILFKRSWSLGVVEEVGEYLVAKELAPILKGLFKRYRDFSAESILPPKARLLVFNYLCYAISQICTSKQIDNENLGFLLYSLKIAACARFEIQFAVEHFKKAFLARTLDHLDSVDEQFVVSSDNDDLDYDLDSVDEQSVVGSDNDDLDSVDDQATDELDRYIRRIMKEEVHQLSKSYVSYSGSRSDVRIMPVLTNLEGEPILTNLEEEPTVQALEIQNFTYGEYESHNSWFMYLKSLKRKSIQEIEEASFEFELGYLLLRDYQSVMTNINRFIEQHCMTTNIDNRTTPNFEVCCYGCELRPYNKGTSYHRCTRSTCWRSNYIRQTNLPRYGLDTIKSTIRCKHDVTHFQEPPSDYAGLVTVEYIASTERKIYSTSGLEWAEANECCFVCGLPLWGTSYGCEKHGSFHKDCVQIPFEIQHFLHPLHPLALRPNSEIGEQRCYVCGRNCRGCAFTCSDCSFFVEVQCVFRKETFKCESHEHLLTVIDAKTRSYPLVYCSTCEMTFKQPFYLYCGLCDYSYHAKCVLPSTITSSHRHPLTVVESHKPDDSNAKCTACEDRIKPNDPVYRCFECVEGNNRTAHIICALSEMEQNDLPEELNIEKYLSDPISNEALITSDPDKWFYYEGKVQSVRREQNIPRTTSGGFTDKRGDQVLEMPPGGLGRSQAEPQQESTTVCERVTRSTPHPMVDNQPSPPPVVELQSEAVASSSAVAPKRRGLTRGLEIPVLIEKNGGKLPVPIPQEHRAPVGIYASKLASKIGVEVRENVQDLSVKSWKAVDEGIKAPLFQHLKDQFHFEGDPIDIHKAIATRCGRRLSDHTHKLYKKFKSLKESKGEGYARSHPPPKISMEQWTSLIEKKWTNKDWMLRSLKNTSNRSSNKTKHRCGSKSLPVRVNEYALTHKGELPNLPEFYKSTHYNSDKDQWIAPECQTNFEKMKQIEAEHNQAGATPLTQEELSVAVLKKRPGYVKGLGLRPSSSIRTTCESATTIEYMTRLEKKLEERDETIEKLLEENKQQQVLNAGIMKFLIEKGYTGHLGSGGLSSND